ncbi:MAG: DMT family transporter [Bacillota bacterium]|nr:DMT family transporter [Bacillota bacterium]
MGSKNKINERGLAHALMVFMVLAWGFDYVPAKWAMEVMSPEILMFFKFSLGAVFIFIIKITTGNRKLIRLKDLPIFILCAIFGQICYFECEYNAMGMMPVALLTIVLAFVPALSVVLERIIYKRKANGKIYFGIFACLVGIAMVVGADFGMLFQGRGFGYLLAMGAVVCWNIYNFITASIDGYDSVTVSLMQTICTSVMLIPFALHSMPPASDFSPLVIFGLLWIGLIDSGVGYLIVVYGLKILGPTTNAVYSNFLPVTTAFFGLLFLGETITFLQVIGGIIVIAAGFIVIKEKGRLDDAASK